MSLLRVAASMYGNGVTKTLYKKKPPWPLFFAVQVSPDQELFLAHRYFQFSKSPLGLSQGGRSSL